ncbi:neuralized-like protein 4 isoform X2 [Dendronephthya gigantea]|uniref:neuralized-like protein 4 isoform X2 n=1 Tax=Dendronephthya gigantea TaxID=151771 RepID=UPI00106D5781|nr:neuralized-like protein 4 isoform X2 [Dendronephthya gigantea]
MNAASVAKTTSNHMRLPKAISGSFTNGAARCVLILLRAIILFQRLGITTCNPDQSSVNIVRAATDLFSDDFKDFWILSGSRLHHGVKEEDYSLNLHTLEVDSRVGVQVTQNGDLVYYINGTSMGAAACDIPTKKPIYCIFDIYGRTKVISKELFQAEKLENICKKRVRELVTDDNLSKLLLPKCILEDIRKIDRKK